MPRIAAKAAYITISGTRVEITKASPSIPRGLAPITDSSNYDATSDLIWPAQIAVTGGLELAVEGMFYTESTGTTFLNWIFTAQTAVPCILHITPLLIFGHGNFDITDFKMDLNITEDTAIGFSCTFKSNGVFTPNS